MFRLLGSCLGGGVPPLLSPVPYRGPDQAAPFAFDKKEWVAVTSLSHGSPVPPAASLATYSSVQRPPALSRKGPSVAASSLDVGDAFRLRARQVSKTGARRGGVVRAERPQPGEPGRRIIATGGRGSALPAPLPALPPPSFLPKFYPNPPPLLHVHLFAPPTPSPSQNSRGSKTFRPRKEKSLPPGSLKLKRHIDATLGAGNIKEAVRLPPGEDLDEWLAANTTYIYEAAGILYGMLEDSCTNETCPTMSAGSKFEYLWADGARFRKPTKLSAPQYLEHLFGWIEGQLDDETLFPVDPGDPFPSHFGDAVRTIIKRLFRVYGHVYHHHFRQVCSLGATAHLNTHFKHLLHFALHFNLVDQRELAPLSDLIKEFVEC